MNLDRIKLLEKYIQEDPNDPFSRYALALELAREDANKAVTILLSLIKDNPQYVPSYYQVGVLMLEQNKYEETRIILEQGIKNARQQKDHKAANEMKQLLEELD